MLVNRQNGSRQKALPVALFIIFPILLVIIACNRHVCSSANMAAPCGITAPVDSVFGELFADNEPGAIVMIMQDSTIVYDRAFGLARIDKAQPVTDSTLFNLSSASKIFTATALLKLKELGLISLDDSLAKYFPEFKGEFFKKITIRHILTHSSGLPETRPKSDAEWNKYVELHNSIFVNAPDYRLYGSEDEHMLVFENLYRLEFEPGTHYKRDDPAYILVAPLIERVTGIPFEKWMADHIFRPAGLHETFYYEPEMDTPRFAHGYRRTNSRSLADKIFSANNSLWEEYDYGEADFFLTRADRGAYTSARDFMQWNRALFSGKIISDSSIAEIYKAYIPTHIPSVSFGLGTAIVERSDAPVKGYHINNNGGFSITEGCWPEKKIYYIILSSRADWDQRAAAEAVDSIIRSHRFAI